ncbi:hypothetical protein GA0111570_113110 [Raineyella antarctica]|uniref:Uncharacterized protein n=1 Tax=Raineyella antarctica TaxID=1577474 RepID=A0A1G6I187_9ACTN|nr:hypothetical protein [Raineyella antarctica]SDC00317.1 hypothetical protein GA0111570_113110 [Raineyella antarctica]
MPVQGVVVPVNAGDLTIRAQAEDVHVINRKRLRRYLLGLPTVLPPDAISTVFAAARLSSTWST